MHCIGHPTCLKDSDSSRPGGGLIRGCPAGAAIISGAMPELPEVETVVRSLRPHAVGRTILSVRLGKTDFMDNPAEMERTLPGCAIRAVQRHGKCFTLELHARGTPMRLLVHLGMTGQLAAFSPDAPHPRHTHMTLALDNGRELRYADPRRFGRIALLSEGDFAALRAGAGPEPLTISAADFQARLAHRRARIKALLLDQHVLGGIGNIYADESLWRARLHPARLAARIAPPRLLALRRAIQKILAHAIELGGSSISDYRDADGRPGFFQLRHRVYDREGRPCFRCSSKIRRILVAGRSSYFCPRCQPAPRPQPRSGTSKHRAS